MPDFNYSDLFYLYYTIEDIPFTLKNSSITFPEEKDFPLYQIKYISSNIPWTILSYQIYGTIDYWWILCTLNRSHIFYAKENTEIRIINPDYIEDIITTIKEQNVS